MLEMLPSHALGRYYDAVLGNGPFLSCISEKRLIDWHNQFLHIDPSILSDIKFNSELPLASYKE